MVAWMALVGIAFDAWSCPHHSEVGLSQKVTDQKSHPGGSLVVAVSFCHRCWGKAKDQGP